MLWFIILISSSRDVYASAEAKDVDALRHGRIDFVLKRYYHPGLFAGTLNRGLS